MSHIRYEKSAHVGRIVIDRPEKRNAFNVGMFRELGDALASTEKDEDVRCVLVSAAGDDFTTGLDFGEVAPAWASGERPFTEEQVDPWEVMGIQRKKPLVVAVHGRCFTLGTELALAADVTVAGPDTRFSLREVRYGIFPAGGGTFRFIRAAGWGNAMRYVLTGDDFGADEALRLHVVQEVSKPGEHLAQATAIAEKIAGNAPLAVRAALRSARLGQAEGWRAEAESVPDSILELLQTSDAQEAISAFIEKRTPVFQGR